MRTIKLNIIFKLMSFIIGCTLPLWVKAQKLPNIQTTGVWLPETVKIDGKLNEWDNGLSANNKSNHLQYTLANNDKYLYLAVKSADKVTVGKIIAGGVNLTMKFPDDNQQTALGIVYPLGNAKYKNNSYAYLDSVKISDMVLMAKEIKVLNFKTIPDSLISVYNSYGIKSSISYNKGLLIYELMLPLNVLGIPYTENSKFNYKIKLDGFFTSEKLSDTPSSPPPAPMGLPANRSPFSDAGMALEMREPTDFSGKYVLYKK